MPRVLSALTDQRQEMPIETSEPAAQTLPAYVEEELTNYEEQIGEMPRAGRWRGMDKSECGLH
jgi:hypothetical protein